jgi:hypothetical protein
MVSSWLRHENLQQQVVWTELGGPAVDIFKRKLPAMFYEEQDFGVSRPALLISGTGVTGFETEHRLKAQTSGIRTVAYIDHWKNYRERFQETKWMTTPTGLVLPEEIWVTDKYARALARDQFDEVPIIIKGNPYLDDIVEAVWEIEQANPTMNGLAHILVVLEKGMEEQTVDLTPRWSEGSYTVRYRLHPSDGLSKRPLGEDIAWADAVVGWDSMALAAAYLTDRPTYSLLPAEERSLPYPIELLNA